MTDMVLEKLESGVDHLLETVSSLRGENRALRAKLVELESRQGLVRDRLDNLIAKLEGFVAE